MGIRNLAYAHLVSAPVSSGEATGVSGPSTYQRPSLVAWKRVVISRAPNGKSASTKRKKGHRSSDKIAAMPLQAADGATEECLTREPEKEAFDPSTFANYAYKFIKSILTTHQPTHILIERQRFRSGGASAVQEWTIRVGIFEGMLHAVLKTLSAEHHLQVFVQAVDPGRVTRYWLEGAAAQGRQRIGSAKESKKAKVDIVGESLGWSDGALISLGFGSKQDDSQEVGQVVDAFLAKWKKDPSLKHQGMNDLVKLDDLSDCLLQGVAWLNWQNSKQEVLHHGLGAFADDPVFQAVCSSHSKPVLKRVPNVKSETSMRKAPRSRV
jgi:cruciform cutting endonuclease 1